MSFGGQGSSGFGRPQGGFQGGMQKPMWQPGSQFGRNPQGFATGGGQPRPMAQQPAWGNGNPIGDPPGVFGFPRQPPTQWGNGNQIGDPASVFGFPRQPPSGPGQEPMNSGLHPYQGGPQNPVARPAGGFGGFPTGGGQPAPQGPQTMQAQSPGMPQNVQDWDGVQAVNNLSGNGALRFTFDPSKFGKDASGMRFSSAALGSDFGLGAGMQLTDINGNPIGGPSSGQARGLGGLDGTGMTAGQQYLLNYTGRQGATPFRISGNFR